MLKTLFVLLVLGVVCQVDSTRVVTGIHFDVEPQSLPEWNTNVETIASEYVSLLSKLKTAVGTNPLCLTVDVPMAYGIIPLNASGTTAFAKAPLMDSVFPHVDRVALMDYRNSALGPQHSGIVAIGQPFITYAQSVGKKVVIGLETTNQQPSYITFYGLGYATMETEIGKVYNAWKSSSAFDLFAIEDATGYQAFGSLGRKPTYPRDTWLWDTSDYFGNPTATAKLVTWAKANNIRTIYFDSESMLQPSSDKTKLKALITAFGNAGICIEFLFGNAQWAYTANQQEAVNLVNLAVNFLHTLGSDYTSGTATCGCGLSGHVVEEEQADDDLEEEEDNATTDDDDTLNQVLGVDNDEDDNATTPDEDVDVADVTSTDN